MSELKRTMNILEMSSIYDICDAIWFQETDVYPSRAEYRPFVASEEVWNEWVKENLTVVNTHLRIRSNDTKLKLKQCVARLKSDHKVIISWRVNHDYGKGKLEISNMNILFSNLIDPDFDIHELDEKLSPMKLIEEKKSKVYMVVQRQHGLDLQDFDIDIPTFDIDLNYGPEWAAKHEHLIDTLTNKKKKGIALLHGLPGTGKSMYIRHLISTLCENKTVVYLPNQLIPSITDPGFIPLMAEYSGSILVIEDADEAIKARKNGGATVDKLLNLADGILSDFLGMQIICTFNSDITTIDEALLRKGRLILKHKFDKLTKENAQKLSDKLGFKTEIKDAMTLAEIYNQEDIFSDVKSDEPAKIGFGR